MFKEAEGILDKIKDTASDLSKDKAALSGLGGAAAGTILSHYIQDPENRSLAKYLMGALSGGAVGYLGGSAADFSDIPETIPTAGSAVDTIPAKAVKSGGKWVGKATFAGIPYFADKAIKNSMVPSVEEMNSVSPEDLSKVQKVLNKSDNYFNPRIDYNSKAYDSGLKGAAFPKTSIAFAVALALLLKGKGSRALMNKVPVANTKMGGIGKALSMLIRRRNSTP